MACLMDGCRHPPLPEDALIRAVDFLDHEHSPASPAGVFEYLLDRHRQSFNVHYRRPDRTRKHIYDPRDMTENHDKLEGRPRTEDLKITALHMTPDGGPWDVVAFLLDRGAKKDEKDGLGRTALEIATVEGRGRDVIAA